MTGTNVSISYLSRKMDFLLDLARDSLAQVLPFSGKTKLSMDYVRLCMENKKPDLAEQGFDQIILDIQSVQSNKKQLDLCHIALNMVKNSDYAEGFNKLKTYIKETLNTVEDKVIQFNYELAINSKLIDWDNFEQVNDFIVSSKETLFNLSENSLKREAYKNLCELLIINNKLEAALDLSKEIVDKVKQADILYKICEAYYRSNDRPAAQKVVTSFLISLAGIAQYYIRDNFLTEITSVLAHQKEFDLANSLVSKIKDKFFQEEAIKEISIAYAEQKDFFNALRFFDKLFDNSLQNEAFKKISTRMIVNGEFNKLLGWIPKVDSVSNLSKGYALNQLAAHLFENENLEKAFEQIDKLVSLSADGTTSVIKAEIIKTTAITLAVFSQINKAVELINMITFPGLKNEVYQAIIENLFMHGDIDKAQEYLQFITSSKLKDKIVGRLCMIYANKEDVSAFMEMLQKINNTEIKDNCYAMIIQLMIDKGQLEQALRFSFLLSNVELRVKVFGELLKFYLENDKKDLAYSLINESIDDIQNIKDPIRKTTVIIDLCSSLNQ